MNSSTAWHEARHAAMALMCGIEVLEATANSPEPGTAGHVTYRLADIGRDPRSFALSTLLGNLDRSDWPPAWPSKGGSTKDERQLAAVVSALGLSKREWRDLCDQARGIAARSEFKRLENAVALLLEQGLVLDERHLKHIHTITERAMQTKTMEAKTTVATERGEFVALAAAWTVDRQGEQIARGAFSKTIARWQASNRDLPVHWNHGGSADAVIGSVFPDLMRETAEGLYVEGRLDLDDSEVAREAWRSMKANRVALSFGYLATQSHKRADGVLELTELDLFEVSIVPAPANPDTRFLSFKSAEEVARILSLKGMTPSEELRRRCIEAGVPPDSIDTEQPRAKRIDSRPIRIASFEC
jgi:HK97 family phage prohead protease